LTSPHAGKGIEIRNCVFRNFWGRAVSFYGVYNVKISYCRIHNVSEEAINIDHYTYNCRAVGNKITSSGIAIKVNDAARCTLTSNVIENCETALNIWHWHLCKKGRELLNSFVDFRDNTILNCTKGLCCSSGKNNTLTCNLLIAVHQPVLCYKESTNIYEPNFISSPQSRK